MVVEPYEDHVLIFAEDYVATNQDEPISQLHIPLGLVEKHIDDLVVSSRRHNLEKHVVDDTEPVKKEKFQSRIDIEPALIEANMYLTTPPTAAPICT